MERETDLHCSAARLCPEDGRVLDALLDHIRADDHDNKRSWPATALNYSDAERATRMTRLLGLIERCPVEQPPDDLVRSTLDRITQAKQSEMFAQQIQTLSMTTPNRFRLNDLLAVAAVILIGLSLAIPVLTQSQGDARRLACMSNLGMTGRAVAAYENDHAGMLPRRKTVAGTPWYMVGQPQASADAPVRSNSAHYFILMRNGYLAPQFLACPDNIHAPATLDPHAMDWPNADAVSYSYTNQYMPRPLRAEQAPDMPVLADKNPLFIIGKRFQLDKSRPKNSVSVFHGPGGQNVLLRNGTVRWITRPMAPGNEKDHLFLLEGVNQYSGTEVPKDAGDAFLVP